MANRKRSLVHKSLIFGMACFALSMIRSTVSLGGAAGIGPEAGDLVLNSIRGCLDIRLRGGIWVVAWRHLDDGRLILLPSSVAETATHKHQGQ